MARKKRGSPRRPPWRAAMHLAFPELHLLLQDLTPPTSVRLLQGNPTPEASVRQGRGHCLAPWQPRRGWGPWHPETGQPLSALAPESSGLTAPYQSAACESQALAQDLADALAEPV